MQVYNIGALPLLRNTILSYDGQKIIPYGTDNLYPSRAKMATLESPLCKSAVLLLADFVEGDGFTSANEEPLNSYGHLDNDLLLLAAEDFETYEGFAILVNLDGTGKEKSYFVLPFETVRYAKPEKDGRIKYVYVSPNWLTEGQNDQEAEKYPLIMPGEKLDALNAPNGAIFYYTGLRQEYPLAKVDAIFDTAQANAEVQLFQLSNIRNGFHSATIFKHYGGFKSKKEEQRYKDNIQELIGAENANSTFIIDMDEDLKDTDLFEQLPANNNDTLFDSTTGNILATILQHFNVPPSLMGVTSDGAVFTQANILDDYTYMNLRTLGDRRIIERAFKALGINESPIKEKEAKQPDQNGGDTTDPGGAEETPPAEPELGPGED